MRFRCAATISEISRNPTNPIRTGNITFSESILAFTNSNDTLFIDNNNAFYAVDAIDINNPTIIITNTFLTIFIIFLLR